MKRNELKETRQDDPFLIPEVPSTVVLTQQIVLHFDLQVVLSNKCFQGNQVLLA